MEDVYRRRKYIMNGEGLLSQEEKAMSNRLD